MGDTERSEKQTERSEKQGKQIRDKGKGGDNQTGLRHRETVEDREKNGRHTGDWETEREVIDIKGVGDKEREREVGD
jgi:hypothetical protein